MSSKLESQITIALQPELLQLLSTIAERESRSVAGQIRHFCIQAARRAGPGTPADLQPLPEKENITDSESLARAKKRLAWIRKTQGPYWMDAAEWLDREIKQFENANKVKNGAKG